MDTSVVSVPAATIPMLGNQRISITLRQRIVYLATTEINPTTTSVGSVQVVTVPTSGNRPALTTLDRMIVNPAIRGQVDISAGSAQAATAPTPGSQPVLTILV